MGKATGEVIGATVFAINGKWKQLSCLVLFGIYIDYLLWLAFFCLEKVNNAKKLGCI